MSRYRTISVKVWGDDKFRRLSKPQPNAQTLWFYLLTGEHTKTIPGAFVAGEAALAEALGWPVPAFRKAFQEVLDLGLALIDRETRLVFLPKAVRHNPPQSPNVVKAWRKSFDELPDCQLKERIFGTITASLKVMGFSKAYVEAFGDVFSYDFNEVIEQDIGESEQEQEQEQEDPPKAPLKFDSVYSPDFEIFWTAYPRKTGKGKAWENWRKIRPSRDLQTKILNAVAAARASPNWKRDNGQYIPLPATWLHQRRWDDEAQSENRRASVHDFL